MLNLILILLLIHYIGFFIFKPKGNMLCCGIFGQATNRPARINSSNIKILGLFNESRGKHSCGITVDSEIYHGLEQDKLFTDFIKGRDFKATENPIVIGHTRQASWGAAINEHNAHPFGFDLNERGGFKFIGVHNGTLYNHLELAKMYNIETKVKYTSKYNIELDRDKIDSEILLEIIHQERNYKVLSEYIGKAALVWTDTDAPNVIYLWSGKSRNSEAFITGAELEERPMNVWIENRNSFYFSSLPESLEVIGAPKKDVFQIEYNTVYQVTNGDFAHALKTEVSRKQSFQTETIVTKTYTSQDYSQTGKDVGGVKNTKGSEDEYCDMRNYHHNVNSTKATSTLEKDLNLPEINIFNDLPILGQNDYKNKIYSYKLRYWKTGHLIEGIFTYIPHYGFYELGQNDVDAKSTFKRIKGLRFHNGEFIKDRSLIEGLIPFPTGPAEPVLYYFLKGAEMREAMDYYHLKDNVKIKNNYDALSHCSKHPIIDMTFDFKHEKSQNILYDGKLYTGTIKNLGFEKAYHVTLGNLLKVDIIKENNVLLSKGDTTTPDLRTSVVHQPKILEAATLNLKNFEEQQLEEEGRINAAMLKLQNLEDSTVDPDVDHETIVSNIIDKEVTPCLMSFQNCREELNLLPDTNPKVRDAKALIAELITTINIFVN